MLGRSSPHGPLHRWAVVLWLCALVSGCKTLAPSNDRVWSPDQAILPHAEVDGDLVTVKNIRNNTYLSEFDYVPAYYNKSFNLQDLQTLDYIVVPFPGAPSLAHTMLSFGFADQDYLGCSIEIRKEIGEKFDSLAGFFRQYEIMYVLADERDLIKLRTQHRLNDVYLYRTKASPEQVRGIFLEVLAKVNKLEKKPEFYNTLTNNCTTNIMEHVNHVIPHRIPYEPRVLLPGYSDQLAYEIGFLDTDVSFEETKLRARINEKAYRFSERSDFSQLIRR